MEIIILPSGKKQYSGSFFDFNYLIEKDTDQEFEDWVVAKLKRYKMDDFELKVYRRILGLDKLMDRIKVLEEKIK